MIALYVVLIVALAMIAVVLVTPWRMSRADAFGCRAPWHVGCAICKRRAPYVSQDCRDRGQLCPCDQGCDHYCHFEGMAVAAAEAETAR